MPLEKPDFLGIFAQIQYLRWNVLMDCKMKVLEKGFDYAPIQSKINEPELPNDFEEFCRRMRLKWYFHNESTSEFSDTLSFTPKSPWKPPKDHPSLEVSFS